MKQMTYLFALLIMNFQVFAQEKTADDWDKIQIFTAHNFKVSEAGESEVLVGDVRVIQAQTFLVVEHREIEVQTYFFVKEENTKEGKRYVFKNDNGTIKAHYQGKNMILNEVSKEGMTVDYKLTLKYEVKPVGK